MTTDVQICEANQFPVRTDSDRELVASETRQLAEAIGFESTAIEELDIVARELTANVIDHAEEGTLVVSQIVADARDGIRLESKDTGPGVANTDEIFADGYSTTGTLGGGLGAVNRLTDHVAVKVAGDAERGTHVVADRWVRPAYEQTVSCPLDVGAASRPRIRGTPNGDTFLIKRWNDHALVGVIDGLGHGREANRAAVAARTYVEDHFDQPLEALFSGADRACRGTRGVVMALARFDWRAETVDLTGIGNIGCKLDGPETGIVTRRGVVGGAAPDPVIRTLDWDPSYRMALHSDGISTRWDWQELDEHRTERASIQARTILNRFGKPDDDTTVLVVTPLAETTDGA